MIQSSGSSKNVKGQHREVLDGRTTYTEPYRSESQSVASAQNDGPPETPGPKRGGDDGRLLANVTEAASKTSSSRDAQTHMPAATLALGRQATSQPRSPQPITGTTRG